MGLSLDWLLTGDGAMYRGSAGATVGAPVFDPQEEAVLTLFRSLGDAGKRDVQSVAEEKKRLMDVERRLKELMEALADSKRPA